MHFKCITTFFILLFVNMLSAQTVSLSPAQCGQTIQYGEPIFCAANDSATEYEFKFFTLEDTVVISSEINYVSVEKYYNTIQNGKSYNVVIRCRFDDNWGNYGDTCVTMITIDWFSEMQAYNNETGNRSESSCNASDLETEYLIPVVFHVIVPSTYNGEDIMDYLPPYKINEQLKIINEFFAGQRAQTEDSVDDANLRFCFATKDINENDLEIVYHGVTYHGITYKSINENLPESIEDLSYPYLTDNEHYSCSYYTFFPRNKYLNIFVFENMSRPDYYGEAGSIRLNDRVPFSHIRIRRDVVGENPEMRSNGKNKGYTAVHELGHFFGLMHTFPQYANEIDPNDPHPYDNIPDIEIQYYAPSPLADTYTNGHNVMNYVPDEEKRFFTPGQVCRMRETIETSPELSSLCHQFPTPTECAATLPDICSAHILTPIENIVCSNRNDIITISVDNVNIVKQVKVNGESISLSGNNVNIDTTANLIEIQHTYGTTGLIEIEVSCGYDNISSDWHTTRKIIEAVECETPTENLEQAQWYYDSYASLDFRDGLAKFQSDSNMEAYESESSVCDSEGNLLFYTDGRQIWNSQHELLTSSTFTHQVKDRSTIILKFSAYIYAILSISETDGKLYSCIINVNNNSPLDASTTLTWSQLPLGVDWTNLSVLSATPTVDANKYWLLTTKKVVGADETTTYYKCVAKLTYNNGIVVSEASIDSNHPLCNSKILSIKVSPNAQYVLYSTESDGILFYRFYTRSGEIESIGNCSPTIGAKGGAVEFSQDGRFLYVAWSEGTFRLMIAQYDMQQLTPCACDIQESVILDWEAEENFQTSINLQRASDGRIYIGRYSEGRLSYSRMIGVILNPNIRDEDNGRSNACGVSMHAIDYNELRFLNRQFFPNLLDVTTIDSCKIDFQVCGDWCPGDTTHEITIVNLSNTPHNTWWFYDEDNNLIEMVGSNFFTDNNGRPNIPQSVYLHDFVTIKLTSSLCPYIEQIRTIGRRDNNDVNIDILGPAKICNDEQQHSYHVDVQGIAPPLYINWTSPFIQQDYDLHLIYDQNHVVGNQIPITVNVGDATTRSCPYAASMQVEVTEIDYVSTPSTYCNEDNTGMVLFTINEDTTTNYIPEYNFSDAYGNIHTNENSFIVSNLPIGEYSFDIVNEFCHYEKTINIEPALSDINYSVSPGCKTDTIKIWRDNNATLNGYLFTLNGYTSSYDTTTNQSELMFVVNRPGDNAPYIIDSNCSIDITGPAPDFCSLHIELYVPPHPIVNVISNCADNNTGQVEIIISNVNDPASLSFVGSDFNVDEEYFLDVDGNLHYYISNISCSYMYNRNNILRIINLIGNYSCPLYEGPIHKCNAKVNTSIKYRCDSADITLAIAGIEPWSVEWDWGAEGYAQTPIVYASDSYYSYLIVASVGTYHYTISFGNCIREGTVDVLEMDDPEYTVEVTNNGNNSEVCVNIVSLPPDISRLVAHDTSGNELTNQIIRQGERYCFESNAGYNAEIITICDTFPIDYKVYDVTMDVESEACYKSEADISFEISGGTAPYTATFTSGTLTTTQTITSSGLNVMHAEIMQGAANSLVVESSEGHSCNITLDTINYISGFMRLQVPIQGSYIDETLVVPSYQPLPINRDVTFTNCTIYCAYNGYNTIEQTRWTIQQGKTVTFNNCIIKSGCPDKMWQGIRIAGDPTAAHSSTGLHGKVICQNNTTIEDAIKALESVGGGIIMANDCNFNNNKYDIYYGQYSYSHSLGSGNNIIPNIYDCTFSTTRLLNDNSIFPDAHICMNNVKGIQIGGCTFENTIPYSTSIVQEIGTPYYTDCRGIGIKSELSNFYTYSSNSFDKLYYGVYVSGFKSNAVNVSNSVFTDNYRGIYVNSNPGCIIKNNSIAAYPGSCVLLNTSETVKFGAYIESCTAFTFEENNISNFTTGMYVYNTGTSANKIRYNTFTGATNTSVRTLLNALIVTGVNSNYISGNNSTGGTGLEILCNNFNVTNYDIGIKDGYMRRYQGENNAPTGNQFLATDVSIRGHYQFRTQFTNAWNSAYNVYQYDYYQHDDTGNTSNYVRELQSGHYSSRVTAHTIYNFGFNESYCQCNNRNVGIGSTQSQLLQSTGLSALEIMPHIQQLSSMLSDIENELKSKIDGGNTENTLMIVSAISSVNEMPIEDLSFDGYLSDTVCKTLVNKIDDNPTYITSVFIENSPLPTETFDDVQDADISSIYKTILAYYQSGENARIADERAVGNIRQEISLLESLLYQKVMSDTINTTDYNIILDYFTSKGDLDDKIKACNMLISRGNYTDARQLLSDISSFGTNESLNCADVIDMYISTMDTSMTKDMLKQRRNQLENFIIDNNYLYSGVAKILYEYAFDTILPKYTPLFIEELSPKITQTKIMTIKSPYVIYPNPTRDFINIEIDKNELDNDLIEFYKQYGIDNIENCETIQVNIYDINSRLVNSGKYKYDSPITINVREYSSGSYLVEIKSCNNYAIQIKIVKL